MFYVWMGCYQIGEDTDDFLNMFIRTLGEDSNVEDGWNGSPIVIDENDGKEDVGKVAHPRRTRKSVTTSNNPPASSSADKNSSLDRLANAIADSKKAENNAWASENARDTMLANMLVAPGCPSELKNKLVGYFDGILDDAVLSRRK
jgi:hypothetical protein